MTRTSLPLVPYLMVSVALLGACGGHASKGHGDDDMFGSVYLNQPNQLPLANSSCQNTLSLALTTPSVKEVSYGMRLRQTVEQIQDDTRVHTNEDLTMVEKPKLMASCPVSSDSHSVEGVAGIAMTQLDHVFQFYGSLPSTKPADRLALSILPLYEYAMRRQVSSNGLTPKEDKERGYLTDNASWSLSSRGAGMITIYPQSAVRFKRDEPPVWELPMVLAHEYGHDVFHRHFPRIFSDVSANYDAAVHRMDALIFNPNDDVASLRQSPFAGQEAASVASGVHANLGTAVTALNEGIADLFGYYVMDQKPDALPLQCFHQSRDVASATFTDGVPKVIDQDALASFVQQKNLKQYPTDRIACERTRWYEAHTFGAAMAHGVDQVYTALGLTTSAAKADKLLHWEDLMNQDYEDGVLGTSTFLDFALRRFAQSAAGATISPAFCQAMDANFPAFTSLWRSEGARAYAAFKEACPAPS